MAKVTLTFDSPREAAAASTVPAGEFDRILTDYLATIIRRSITDALDKASIEDQAAIMSVVDTVQGKLDAAEAAKATEPVK